MDLTEDEISEVKSQAEGSSLETLLLLFDLLVAGEQAMAHSNQPRLVLEMTVAKMAQLKPVVPIPEILAQLKELESRLAGSAPRQPIAAALNSPVQDPTPASAPAGPAPVSAIPAPTATASVDPAGNPWENFLAYAGQQDSKLAALLAGGHFKGLTEKELRVAFAPDSLGLERLTSKGNAPKLNHLAAGFFGEGHRLVVLEESLTEPAAAPRHRSLEADKIRREALENPVVKAVSEILEGRIEEIKTK